MGIMWQSLVKIQYTELKLSWGNDPAARHTQSHNTAPSQDGRIKLTLTLLGSEA